VVGQRDGVAAAAVNKRDRRGGTFCVGDEFGGMTGVIGGRA
jgi:hypothetical protein